MSLLVSQCESLFRIVLVVVTDLGATNHHSVRGVAAICELI